LPEYMVPSAFMTLDSLPLTANGKLNVRELPAPEPTRPELNVNYRGPRTPIEKMLCDLWIELLDVESVGIDDNFFDLGGHSILGTVMISSVRKQINVDLPVRSIFELPTVAELASLISEIKARGVETESLPIARVSRVPQRMTT
jgi:acyl carrier protein